LDLFEVRLGGLGFELLGVQSMTIAMLHAAPLVKHSLVVALEDFVTGFVQCVVHTRIRLFFIGLLIHVLFAICRIRHGVMYTTLAVSHNSGASRTFFKRLFVIEVQMSFAV
jgi:hypothetical protein